MNNIKEIKTVSSCYDNDFDRDVNVLLKAGYKMLENPTAFPKSDEVVFYVVMVKYHEQKV